MRVPGAFAVCFIATCLVQVTTAQSNLQKNYVAGELVTFKQNGGWNWFSDNRVLIDGERMLIGTVAGTSRPGMPEIHAGDVQVTTYSFADHRSSTVTLAATFAPVTPVSASDDHMVPVFLKLPDGRYLAVWQRHDTDALMRWAISANPGDASSWQNVQTASANPLDKTGLCFSNVVRLSAENGRIYNFARSVGSDPNYLFSDDDGRTFHYGGRLMKWDNPAGKGLGRPYVRYATNDVGTIWLATTEDHPKDYNTGIWAGYIKAGKVFKSDGALIGPLSTTAETAIQPTSFTQVFEGKPDAVAYINDLQIDSRGTLYLTFSIRKDDGHDLRYCYSRFDGKAWHTSEIAYAGSTIYMEESSYAGLAALDPNDPDTMYISANANPATGEPLISDADSKRHFEIFKGQTTDAGVTWKWSAITSNSTHDNIRPLIPKSDKAHHVLLWLRGAMTTFKNYDLDVVGVRGI